MVMNIPNYALIQLYGYYYTVLNCTLSTLNELILLLYFNTELLRSLYINTNNIEIPILLIILDIPGILIGLGIVF